MFFKKIRSLEAAYNEVLAENAQLKAENDHLVDALHEAHNSADEQAAIADHKIAELQRKIEAEEDMSARLYKLVQFYKRLPLCSDADLRSRDSNFEVHKVGNDGKYLVVTGYCSRCGCDIGTTYNTEREALVSALAQTVQGFVPVLNSLCDHCKDTQ